MTALFSNDKNRGKDDENPEPAGRGAPMAGRDFCRIWWWILVVERRPS